MTYTDFFVTGRPTAYNGIKMRSRLEATWAAHLDQLGLVWEYEPYCFASPDGQYLPDFQILNEDGSFTYLEVKGAQPDFKAVRRQMAIIWTSEPTAQAIMVRGAPGSYEYERCQTDHGGRLVGAEPCSGGHNWWDLASARQIGSYDVYDDGYTCQGWSIFQGGTVFAPDYEVIERVPA